MGPWIAQPIHKEWPEYSPRPEKGNRRGNFDLCILSPERLRESSFEAFRQGRIRPSIVIEIGLDYSLTHLEGDAEKLLNSDIRPSYLIHLVRQEVADDFSATEAFILEKSSQTHIKTAYARLTGATAYFKLIGDQAVQSVAMRVPERDK
jgi:hypothetical protein